MISLLFICFLAGSIGAMLQGMIGIGTGIIIVPTLTFILPYYHFQSDVTIHIAIATAMAAIAVNSITALLQHSRHGNIDWKVFRCIVIFSTLGAGIAAFIALFIKGYFLKNLFWIVSNQSRQLSFIIQKITTSIVRIYTAYRCI